MRAAQPGSLRPGPGDEVMAGQAVSLKGCFLTRLRNHTCGQERSLAASYSITRSAWIENPMRAFLDRVKAPRIGQTLERMHAEVLELEPGAGD